MSATRFAAAYGALHASHVVGDHIVQSDSAACDKAFPGRKGHLACARHVATYTATQLLALVAVNQVTGARLRPEAIGKAQFFELGAPRTGRDDNPSLGTGAYALDQAAHTGFLFLAALVIAGGES